MFSSLNNTQKGILLALIGYTAFAISDIGAKWLTQSYSIYQIITVDGTIAAILLLLMSPKLGGIASLKDKANAKIHITRALLNFFVNMIIVYCFSFMAIATVYTAVFAKPFFAVLLAIPLYKEKVSMARWGTIAVGFTGILIAFRPWNNAIGIENVLLLLLLTTVIALMFVIVRSVKDSSPMAIGFYPVVGTPLLAAPLAFHTFVPINMADMPVFLLVGACVAIGVSCVSLAFQKADAGAVSPMMYTEMIWAILFGYLIFADLPDMWMLAGAALIIISGIYLLLRESRRRAQ